MGALLKYEIRKTWIAKVILLGIVMTAELVFLAGLFIVRGGNLDNNVLPLGIGLLTMSCFGGLLFIGIQSVLTLHRDMNTRQGYMLWMTPKTSWQILGAKILENGLSLLAAGAFFSLLAILDVTLLFSRAGKLEGLWNLFRQILQTMRPGLELNTKDFLVFMLYFVTSWLATVSIAYLADTLSSSLLNGKRFNLLVSFGFFILLSGLFGFLQNLFVGAGMALSTLLLVQSCVALVFCAAVYFVTAALMERCLSV